MAWISLIIAGFFGTFGIAMIKKLRKNRNWQSIILLIIAFGASFILLKYTMKTIPMGTTYAIWTGISVSSATLLELLFYGRPKDWKIIVFITLILGASIGLILIT